MSAEPQNSKAEWLPLRTDESQFDGQVVAYIKWLVNLLEKTERERTLPKSLFDVAIQERLHRRAS